MSYEHLCEVYMFYNSNNTGRIPILIYPNEDIKYDEKKMYVVNIHSIWFLDLEKKSSFEHTELEYGKKIYFADKFQLTSRYKRFYNSDSKQIHSLEEIVIIVAVSINFTILGRDLLKELSEGIRSYFEFSFYYLVESEILKNEKIKTPIIMEKIGKGNKIKNQIKIFIENSCNKIFSNIIEQKNANVIKEQKAISYCSLKELDINYIITYLEDGTPSIIRIIKPNKNNKKKTPLQARIDILDCCVNENGRELEILLKNNCKLILNEILVKILHVKEFFENEIMNEQIDSWIPQEKILIISPVVPSFNEYLFLILGYQNNERIFEKKIDCNMLKNFNSE